MQLNFIRVLCLVGILFLVPNIAQANQTSDTGNAMFLNYNVYLGGFHALTVEMRVEVNGDRYDSKLDAWIEGLFELLVEFRLDSSVEGRLDNRGLSPRFFRSTSRKNDKPPRKIKIRYADGALPSASVEPMSESEKANPLPADLRRDTVDPLTALLTLGEASFERDGCEGTIAVFDGRRRFDVEMNDLGQTDIVANDYQVFDGAARHCEVRLKRLTVEAETGSEEPKSSYPDKAKVFLARLMEDLPPVPVRMEFRHEYGALRAHLVGYELLD